MNVVSDANSTIDYDYDSLGRITQIDFSGTAAYPDVRIRHSWDDLNRRTNMIMDVHDGTSWIADQWSKMTYDAAGRVTQILHRDADGANGEDVQDKRIDFTYTDINRWDKITRYENTNGNLDELVAQTRYGYDSGHRLTSMTHDDAALSGSTMDDLAVYTWGWDTASRIDSFSATNKTAADESIDYNYDATNQLTKEDFITPIPGQTDNNWEYDANGNRTNTGYSTGTNNRLLSDGTYNYTYDDEGNRTRKTTIATGEYVEYSFDHRNRLTGAKFYDSSDVLQSELIYAYDAMDRLIQREHDTTPGGVIEETEAYVFDAAGKRDGVTTVPLDDIIAVFDETGSLTTRYVHGPSIDQILAEETLNTDGTIDEVAWALGDHQGTVRDLVTFDHSDGSTDIATHRKYDAFGNITTTTGTADFRYAFTGRYYDTDINQQWHSRRWYDTWTAKWTSEDPIGFTAGDVNLMRYVGNSPRNSVDPSGLEEVPDLETPGALPNANDQIVQYLNSGSGSLSAGQFYGPTVYKRGERVRYGNSRGNHQSVWGNADESRQSPFWGGVGAFFGSIWDDLSGGATALANGDAGRGLADRSIAIMENSGNGANNQFVGGPDSGGVSATRWAAKCSSVSATVLNVMREPRSDQVASSTDMSERKEAFQLSRRPRAREQHFSQNSGLKLSEPLA